MSTSTCPVCHSPVNPADDVCENCGAVLSTIVIPPVKTVPSPPAPVIQPATMAAFQDECPRCHARRNPGKSFCGKCGFKYAMPTNNATTTLPSAELQAPIVQLAMDSVINDKY